MHPVEAPRGRPTAGVAPAPSSKGVSAKTALGFDSDDENEEPASDVDAPTKAAASAPCPQAPPAATSQAAPVPSTAPEAGARKTLGFDSDDEDVPSRASSRASRNSRVRFSEAPVVTHQPPADQRDDGSDWDTDNEQAVAAPSKRSQAPAAGFAGQAEQSGWDSEDEAPAPAAGRRIAQPETCGWDDSDEEKATKASSGAIPAGRKAWNQVSQDACGATQTQASAFVAARPGKKAATAAPPAGGGTELDDLVGMLTAETSTVSAPFRGSNSHSFVPGLQCTGCDFQVLRVDGFIWHDEANYMFFRNNYPNVMKLRKNLIQREGCCAYCCQCSWKSADAAADIGDVAEGLKWRQLG